MDPNPIWRDSSVRILRHLFYFVNMNGLKSSICVKGRTIGPSSIPWINGNALLLPLAGKAHLIFFDSLHVFGTNILEINLMVSDMCNASKAQSRRTTVLSDSDLPRSAARDHQC